MKKRTLEHIYIDHIGYGGVGIGTLANGKKVLVKGGLPGSVVNGRVLKRKKDYVELQITEIVSWDEKQVDGDIRCPHYLFPYSQLSALPPHKQGCGGCKWQALSYTKQLSLKHAIVADSLARVVDNTEELIPAVVGSPQQFHYRNKIEFSCGTYRIRKDEEKTAFDETVTVGFHQQGHFAQIIDIDHCFLISPEMHRVYERFKHDLIGSGLPVYRVKQHTGFLRHVVLRQGHHTGQLLVHLSVAADRLVDHPEDHTTRDALLATRKEDKDLQKLVTTCLVTDNNGRADVVQNQEVTTQPLRGPGHIFEELHIAEHIFRFQISPFSFFQTNTKGAEVLFSKAFSLVGSLQGTVLDLYCGSGTIGICALRAGIGDKLVGIEIVQEAIEDAHKNAVINGVAERSHFFVGKVEKLIKEHRELASLVEDLALVIVDPPRQGLHKDVVIFLNDLRRTHTCKLLYISCNPVTFARDIQLLQSLGGWQLQGLQPVDMFPQTYHIELIGLLE